MSHYAITDVHAHHTQRFTVLVGRTHVLVKRCWTIELPDDGYGLTDSLNQAVSDAVASFGKDADLEIWYASDGAYHVQDKAPANRRQLRVPFRFVALDARGHRISPDYTAGYDSTQFASWLVHALDLDTDDHAVAAAFCYLDRLLPTKEDDILNHGYDTSVRGKR